MARPRLAAWASACGLMLLSLPLWGFDQALSLPLILAGVLLVVLVTFASTEAAISLLLLSMLLSPEINVGGVPSRQVVIRIDDFLLFAIALSWIAKISWRQELGLLRWSTLHGPMLWLFLWSIVTTALNIASGELRSPLESAFYLLKYFEYFLVFFLGVNIIRERRQIDLFWRVMVVTALCVGVYGWFQRSGGDVRISAPFEGEKGEPNTLAGYLVLMMGACLGRALFTTSPQRLAGYVALIALLFVPLLNTLSRGGYLAFLTMYGLLIWLTPHRRGWLIIPLVLLAIVGPTMFPEHVVARVQSTFMGATAYGSRGEQLGLDPSAAQRIDVWWWTFDQLKRHPFIGYGVSGLGLVDQQYCLVLGELGIIGAVMYLWTRWAVWRVGWYAYRQLADSEYRGLVLGYLCAYVGLLVHSFAGNIFIIVRIMEPFWFLTAIMVVLPQVLSATPAPVALVPGPAESRIVPRQRAIP